MRTRNQKTCLSSKQGSALVFALIMLSIMLVIAVGSFSSSIIDQKTSNDTVKSVTAFQAADTGIEKVLAIIKNNLGSLQTLAQIGLCDASTNNTYTETNPDITVSFYKTGNILITDCFASDSTIENLESIKSIGEFGGTARAVSVVIKKGGSCLGTIMHEGLEYGLVEAADGRCWLDRNLGATIGNPTSISDSDGYGWYFQWGRRTDDHQVSTSETVAPPLPSVDDPYPSGGGLFITPSLSPQDWRNPQKNELWQGLSGINNPCPIGWRIPTQPEWDNLAAVENENINNYADAFSSSLKLVSPGYRHSNTGALSMQGSLAYYWSSTPSGTAVYTIHFSDSGKNTMNPINRAVGVSVRCIRDK